MRALTLTQPWAGLVASGIKLVENRPRKLLAQPTGIRFAIHASREIDDSVFARIYEIAPELHHKLADTREKARWHQLARITSCAIALATIDRHVIGDIDASGLPLDQRRWYFGPVGYVLRDVVALAEPVPCRGMLGFWTLPDDVAANVRRQLAA